MELEVNAELVQRANDKINLGKKLQQSLLDFLHIPGVTKIDKKIQQEIKFLEKVIRNKTLREINLISSNLVHYEFLIKTLRLQKDVLHVGCVFPLPTRELPIRVDIVANNGLKWIKVIARNSKSIEDAANGQANFGARSVLQQANDYLQASEINPCMFRLPKIVFYFANKIDESLQQKLLELHVQTATLDKSPIDDETEDDGLPNELNLDVTTMLAYVSAVSNGSANWKFKEPLLTEQAACERTAPVKPYLDQIFEGKRLVCCEVAYKAFQNILLLLAGPNEMKRAELLLKRIKVYPDVEQIPEELGNINFTAKVNERSVRIFSFGVSRKILTATSNKAFLRSAKMQGIDVPVYVHASRALTENKEPTATPILPSPAQP